MAQDDFDAGDQVKLNVLILQMQRSLRTRLGIDPDEQEVEALRLADSLARRRDPRPYIRRAFDELAAGLHAAAEQAEVISDRLSPEG
jgi:hypothetical protein